MCKLGFDIRVDKMNENEVTFCRQAVENFHRLSPVTLDGDLFRLVSPYEGEHAAIMYATPDREKAVVFAFDMHPRYGEFLQPVRLQGLDANKRYKVEEINLMPGARSSLKDNGKVYSGDYLMKIGLNLFSTGHLKSHVLEITAQ